MPPYNMQIHSTNDGFEATGYIGLYRISDVRVRYVLLDAFTVYI